MRKWLPKSSTSERSLAPTAAAGTTYGKRGRESGNGSIRISGQLLSTEKSVPRKIRLQERAAEVEEHLREAGGRMQVTDLERQIRRGLLGLLEVFRRHRMSVRGFLRMYPQRFITRSGYVSVKDSVLPPEVPLEEQIRMADERAVAKKEARKQASKERLKGLSSVYKMPSST